MEKIILRALLLVAFASSTAWPQSNFKIMPVAADSTVDETEPYLSRFLYEAAFRIEGEGFEKSLPLWFAYKETTRDGKQFVVGRRIQAKRDWRNPPQINFSRKFVISDSAGGQVLESPLIEYYADWPVAIWRQKRSSRFALFFSVFRDSVWTRPQQITPDSMAVSDQAFMATHFEDQQSPYARFNRLFWISGKTIWTAEMDSTFHWVRQGKVYTDSSEIAHLVPRLDLQKNLWLVFDERTATDSVTIRVLHFSNLKQKWEGPVSLEKIGGRRSFAGFNLTQSANWGFPVNWLELSWLEENTFKSRPLFFQNDSLKTSGYPDFEQKFSCQNVLLTSNNLDLGGCVLGMAPYYFLVCQTDSALNQGYLGNDNNFWNIFSTKHSIRNLAISGTEDFVFGLAWEEWDGSQADVYLGLQTIIIGSVEEEMQTAPKGIQLSPNWPNPFNPSTTLRIQIPPRLRHARATLRIFNLLGQQVRRWRLSVPQSGTIEVTWNATDEFDNELPSGTYFAVVQVKDQVKRVKLLLLR